MSSTEMPCRCSGCRGRVGQAANDGIEWYAARHVRLRVEEDLRVPDAVGRRPPQVGLGQVGEVLLGAEHARAGVVEVEERLEVGEVMGPSEGRHIRVRQPDPVALGQGEDQLRLQGALDVQVQLGLGQCRHT